MYLMFGENSATMRNLYDYVEERILYTEVRRKHHFYWNTDALGYDSQLQIASSFRTKFTLNQCEISRNARDCEMKLSET